MLEILFPRVTDSNARSAIRGIVDALLSSRATVASVVQTLQSEGKIPQGPQSTRTSNFVQVWKVPHA